MRRRNGVNDVIRLGERLRKDLEEIAFANNILEEGEPDIKSTIAFLIERYRQAQKELIKKEVITLKKIYNKIEGAKCVQCGREIKLGELCYYDPENRKVLCARCFVRNNSQGLVNEDLIKAELKLAQLKDEIKALEEEKKKLIKELKIVQIYEELDNKARIISEKIEEIKRFIMDYIKIMNPSEQEKNFLRQKLDELIELEKETAQGFKLLAKAILKR
jgi:hemerythrin-like domain-containing protein